VIGVGQCRVAEHARFVGLARNTKPIAELVVDGGQMAIIDGLVRDDESHRDAMFFRVSSTGLVRDRGCMSESGWGDGIYTAGAHLVDDAAVVVSVDFALDEGESVPKHFPRDAQRGRL
jgi:hypothetical protein